MQAAAVFLVVGDSAAEVAFSEASRLSPICSEASPSPSQALASSIIRISNQSPRPVTCFSFRAPAPLPSTGHRHNNRPRGASLVILEIPSPICLTSLPKAGVTPAFLGWDKVSPPNHSA